MKSYFSQRLYHIGDKVKIVCIDKLKQSQYRNSDGFMDKYAGTFMIIKDIYHGCYRMREDYFYKDGIGFFWLEELIEGKMEDYDFIFSEEDCALLSNPDYNPEEDPDFDVEDLWIPKKEYLTCFDCSLRKECYWVDDLYNTDGDCLALK